MGLDLCWICFWRPGVRFQEFGGRSLTVNARGPTSWDGVGETIERARRRLRAEGGQCSFGVVIILCDRCHAIYPFPFPCIAPFPPSLDQFQIRPCHSSTAGNSPHAIWQNADQRGRQWTFSIFRLKIFDNVSSNKCVAVLPNNLRRIVPRPHMHADTEIPKPNAYRNSNQKTSPDSHIQIQFCRETMCDPNAPSVLTPVGRHH